MYYSKTLSRIPVVTADAKAGLRLHRSRRAVQLGSIAIAIAIPLSGLFRIDPVAGAFVVLDRQIWFSDFYIVVGLWMAVSSTLVMTYSLVGTAFCGWSCPQNTLSEWANNVTRRFLGKRAEVNLDGAPVRLSPGKDKWINWTILGALFLVVSMATAFVPMLYFYSPGALWSFLTFREDPRLAGSLHWIYTVFVLIVLVDIAFIRHFWCRFMCVYRVWQHTFKTTETLRIVHDKAHPEECSRCNFCETSCFVGIDPRNTETFDACINCGACITACSSVRESRGTGNSLLRFELGGGESAKQQERRTNVGSIMLRAPWATAIASFGLVLFAFGLWTYSPYHYSVYRAETRHADAINDYRINVANKLYRPADLRVSVEGLPPESYRLEKREIRFETAGRQDVDLHIGGSLSPGLHPFVVHLDTPDGERLSYRVQHFVDTKGS